MQPDSVYLGLCTIHFLLSSSVIFSHCSMKCTLGSTPHSQIHYPQFPGNQGSWDPSSEMEDRSQRIKAFPFLLPWRQFYDAFLQAPWKVPKGARQLERVRMIVWIDYSRLRCAEFYNKDITRYKTAGFHGSGTKKADLFILILAGIS